MSVNGSRVYDNSSSKPLWTVRARGMIPIASSSHSILQNRSIDLAVRKGLGPVALYYYSSIK